MEMYYHISSVESFGNTVKEKGKERKIIEYALLYKILKNNLSSDHRSDRPKDKRVLLHDTIALLIQ